MSTTPSSQDRTHQQASRPSSAEPTSAVEGEVPLDTSQHGRGHAKGDRKQALSVARRGLKRSDGSSHRRPFSAIASGVAVVATLTVVVGLISGILLHSRHSSVPSVAAPTATSAIVPGSQAHFVDIQMVTPTEGWAVGFRGVVNQRQTGPLLAHVVNGKWMPVDVAYSGSLICLAAISSDDIWAAGMPGAMLHYNGAAWRSVVSPPTGIVNRLTMVGPSDGWAVGAPVDQHAGAFILHYDGATWVQQAAPQMNGFVRLTDISMVSAQEGWVAGTVYPYNGSPASGVLLHYLQGQWLVATTLPSTTILSLSMLSATQGWAVGSRDTYETTSEGTRPSHTALLLRFAAGQWQPAPTPTDPSAVFDTIRFLSPDDGWIIGGGVAGSGLLLLHYTGGHWTQIDGGPPSTHGETHSIDQAVLDPWGDVWLAGSQSIQAAPAAVGRTPLPTSVPFLARYRAGQWVQVTQ